MNAKEPTSSRWRRTVRGDATARHNHGTEGHNLSLALEGRDGHPVEGKDHGDEPAHEEAVGAQQLKPGHQSLVHLFSPRLIADQLSSRLRASPFSSNGHAYGIYPALVSRRPQAVAQLEQPGALQLENHLARPFRM